MAGAPKNNTNASVGAAGRHAVDIACGLRKMNKGDAKKAYDKLIGTMQTKVDIAIEMIDLAAGKKAVIKDNVIIQEAVPPNLGAIKEFNDRTMGKAPQQVEVYSESKVTNFTEHDSSCL